MYWFGWSTRTNWKDARRLDDSGGFENWENRKKSGTGPTGLALYSAGMSW
ncbi:MAG: hypothetical protein ACLURV_11005 [Gallintestinimicrobium sp.]